MTGSAIAVSAAITVPSFWVRYSGASMPLSAIASTKPGDRRPGEVAQRGVEQRGVLALQQADAAQLVRQRDRGVRGIPRRGSFAARSSCDGSSGEKIAAIATARMPSSRICRAAACRIPASSNGMIGRPS